MNVSRWLTIVGDRGSLRPRDGRRASLPVVAAGVLAAIRWRRRGYRTLTQIVPTPANPSAAAVFWLRS